MADVDGVIVVASAETREGKESKPYKLSNRNVDDEAIGVRSLGKDRTNDAFDGHDQPSTLFTSKVTIRKRLKRTCSAMTV
jgi:hypothetical protein